MIGNPFSSASVLIRLRATISPVTLSAPTNTLLYQGRGMGQVGEKEKGGQFNKVMQKAKC